MNGKEKRKIELKEKLNKIAHLFMITKESYLYAEYFHNPETKEEKEILNDLVYYYHFRFINHILFKNTVIELAKLFSSRSTDKFRIGKLIENFKRDGQFGDFGINESSLKIWESYLTKYKGSIDFILKLRDELYAHTDEKEFDYNSIDLSFIKLKELIDLGEKIIKQLYSELFQIGFYFESQKFERTRFPILKVLAIGEEKRKSDISKAAIESIEQHKNKLT